MSEGLLFTVKHDDAGKATLHDPTTGKQLHRAEPRTAAAAKDAIPAANDDWGIKLDSEVNMTRVYLLAGGGVALLGAAILGTLARRGVINPRMPTLPKMPNISMPSWAPKVSIPSVSMQLPSLPKIRG